MDIKKKAEILDAAAELGDSLVKDITPFKGIDNKLGLCATCKNLGYYKTRLMSEAFWCRKFNGVRLNTADPIETCTNYWHRGWVNIWDLKEMAIIIDPVRRKVGFKREDDEDE